MAVVWNHDEISVRDTCAHLGSSVAYTTVMTTMDRLLEGLLARRKSGRAFLYQAAATREELDGAVAAEIVQGLLQRTAAGRCRFFRRSSMPFRIGTARCSMSSSG